MRHQRNHMFFRTGFCSHQTILRYCSIMSQLTMSMMKNFIVIVLSVLIRLILFNSSYQKDIAERVEISTPVSSWKRGL